MSRRLRLRHLSDLGLGEQRHVQADLRERPHRDVEGGAELCDPRAVGVPRQRRLPQPELLGEAARDLGAPVPQRRERAGRAAELDGEPLASERGEPARASTTETSQPAALRPNVVGTACWSSVRPAIAVER